MSIQQLVLLQRELRSGSATVASMALLIAAGTLLGVVVVLSRSAAAAGISAVTFSFWQSLIGGTIILLRGLARRRKPVLTHRYLRYYLATGLCSIGLPNTLLFLTVPHVGAGHASIAYAFPPLLTYLLALLLRLERPHARRVTGLALGALGAVLLVRPDGILIGTALSRWMLLLLLAPVTVALANVYRTLDWPEGASPETLAGGTLVAAAMWIAPLMLVLGGGLPPSGAAWIPALAGIVSAGAFVLSFALQRRSGPVTFSQLGYVVIAVTMGIGALFFGERFDLVTLAALGIVLVALLLATSVPAGRNAALRAARPQFLQAEYQESLPERPAPSARLR